MGRESNQRSESYQTIEIPAPEDYPDRETFRENLNHVITTKDRGRRLPDVPSNPKAINIAQHAQADWQAVRDRGGPEIDRHLYDLGKIMSDQGAYESLFGESDPIVVGKEWKIEEGRDRVLALKALGVLYVARSGMDRWVKVQRKSH